MSIIPDNRSMLSPCLKSNRQRDMSNSDAAEAAQKVLELPGSARVSYSIVETGSQHGCKRYLVRIPHGSRDIMNVMKALLELPAATADGKEQA